jgi:hypothetical protein
MTDSEGEFALQVPKEVDVDSFEVKLAEQIDSTTSLKIMRYRPLVLCVQWLSRPEAPPPKKNTSQTPATSRPNTGQIAQPAATTAIKDSHSASRHTEETKPVEPRP